MLAGEGGSPGDERCRGALKVLPWIFLGLLLLAIIRYVYLRRNRPDVIVRIGNTEMETLGGIG